MVRRKKADADVYYHRIRRTGRAAKKGIAINIIEENDKQSVKFSYEK